MNIPEKGLTKEQVLQTLRDYKHNDLNWKTGRVTSYVYDPGERVLDLISQAYTMYLTESALDPTTCPSILRLENEIVSMVANLVGGDKDTVGNFTSGGTESVMMAVLAARNRARALHPEITAPEMVIPFTAHACFHKAAHYLGVRAVTTPVDSQTFKANPRAMAAAVTPNTILMAASAPGWAHGVVDPIEDIAAAAREHDLLFHVDACVGGIHLPFMRKLGMKVPNFDFSVPGVTSMSVDIHKYGYAAKNASLILYKSKDIRRHQIFACSSWPGYTIVNATAGSSRTCGPLAAAWAVLNHLGGDGYMKIVKEVMQAARLIINGINNMDGLEVMGEPNMCLLAFRATNEKLNVYRIADMLAERNGWHVQPQFARENSTSNLQMGLTNINAPQAEAFIKDLKLIVEELLKEEKPPALNNLATAMKSMQLKADEQTVDMLLQMAGITNEVTPGPMAEVNTILESLPVDLTEYILITYFNNIFSAV